MTEGRFLVIGHEREGQAFLSRREAFATREAAEAYAAGIAACYWPEVVEAVRPVLIGRPEEERDAVADLRAALLELVSHEPPTPLAYNESGASAFTPFERWLIDAQNKGRAALAKADRRC